MEKGENAGNQHFLLFPKCCYPSKINKTCIILAKFKLSTANGFNLNEAKILSPLMLQTLSKSIILLLSKELNKLIKLKEQ